MVEALPGGRPGVGRASRLGNTASAYPAAPVQWGLHMHQGGYMSNPYDSGPRWGQPVPPEQNGERSHHRSVKKFLLVGVGGFFGLIVILGVIGAIVGSPASKKTAVSAKTVATAVTTSATPTTAPAASPTTPSPTPTTPSPTPSPTRTTPSPSPKPSPTHAKPKPSPTHVYVAPKPKPAPTHTVASSSGGGSGGSSGGTSTATCAAHTVGTCAADSPHPAGAMAQCNDGAYSYSSSFRGTCSRHGGVMYWYQ
jgi:hypothetical protein